MPFDNQIDKQWEVRKVKKLRKVVLVLAVVAVVGGLTAVSALANDPAPDVTTIMTSGFQSVVDDVIGMIAATFPIALGVVGMTIAIKFGVRWLRSMVGRG
jgi:hypothetical protein